MQQVLYHIGTMISTTNFDLPSEWKTAIFLVKDLRKLGSDLLVEYGNILESMQEMKVLNLKIADRIYEACKRTRAMP